MIEENSPQQEQILQEVLDAAEIFLSGRQSKSFSERNPELGKMINCYVCGERHRSAKVCVPVYALSRTETMIDDKGEEVPAPLLADQTTKKGAYGAQQFRGRILKHRNKWGLRVIERATEIYNKEMAYYPSVAIDALDASDDQKKSNQEFRDKIGKQSLSQALNELRKARAIRRHRLLKITKTSRRRNR